MERGGGSTLPGAQSGKSGGTWLILFAALLWGTTGTAQALAPPESTPGAIAALRMLLAGTALAAWAVRAEKIALQNWPVLLTVLAGTLIALYQFTIFWAMSETGVAVGTIVAMGSAPIFAGVLEYFIRGKQPIRRWYLSTFMAVAGCFFLVLEPERLYLNGFGVLLALIAGFAYAFYTLSISLLVEKRPALAVIAIVTCVGALFLLPALFQADLSWLAQTNGWLAVLHLGLIATACSYWMFARGLKTVQASTAVTLTLAEPLVAAVLGIVVVGERLNLLVSAGLLLIFSALSLFVFPAGKRVADQGREGGSRRR